MLQTKNFSGWTMFEIRMKQFLYVIQHMGRQTILVPQGPITSKVAYFPPFVFSIFEEVALLFMPKPDSTPADVEGKLKNMYDIYVSSQLTFGKFVLACLGEARPNTTTVN